MNEETKDERYDRLAKVLGNAVAHAANEGLVLARLEEFFSPKPAKLAEKDTDAEKLKKRLEALTLKLGGAPEFIVSGENDERPNYDTYPNAAISEVISVFHRARRSVTRAQMFLTGSHLLLTHPEVVNLPEDEDVALLFKQNVEDVFWEHTETAFIRLSSFWDRIGQLLDFIFFGIRQYERDGFAAVMDRINNNILPVNSEIKKSIDWSALRKYQTSESEDGLKWLLRRRNLIVHSLHLQPLVDFSTDHELFESAYNHLEEKLINKLKPGKAEEEVTRLHLHLGAAASLFHHVLNLSEQYLNTRK